MPLHFSGFHGFLLKLCFVTKSARKRKPEEELVCRDEIRKERAACRVDRSVLLFPAVVQPDGCSE
jgi:hypothetical protein